MKRTSYIKLTLIFASVIAILFSCKTDKNSSNPEETGLIYLQFSSEETSVRSEPEEKEIRELMLFIFHGDRLEVAKEYPNPTIPVMEVVVGHKDVYVVANPSPALKLKLKEIKTKAGFDGSLITTSQNTFRQPPFEMFGKVEGVEVRADQPETANISLKRVVAKISIKLVNEEVAAHKLVVEEILLENNADHTTLIEGLTSTSNIQNYSGKITGTGGTYVFDQSGELQLDPVYVNEYKPSAVDKATALVIRGKYDDIPTTYRAVINSTISGDDLGNPSEYPNDGSLQILRNYHYKITATITRPGAIDGLVLKTDVLPWNVVQSHVQVKDDPIETLFNVQFTQEEHETSMSSPFSFEFTLLKAEQGTKWVATLDNGNEFAFADPASSYGEIGQKKTITVRPLKAIHGGQERKTKLTITLIMPSHEKKLVEFYPGQTSLTIKQINN
ncbi:FimB/Mfa2 family fimbrial subunit [Porphyromonas sp.]|uniref:FimB/Mfa2 family fimbrial subunit n=1 Tax=Porphyromonas sp. TaxID=1924944 RepID=UPI0026DB41CE|nr:FimB/Mfa2 family fimbrial subunit [Porphyromonas sp.]MDO4695662.1 FimB/Mfa2 family fimbrial subunit [Porphyromonas sp.]MDO4770317.1 FimB/Mfa2 family fimbrial subunit [Porphyromonas sp.]